MSQKLQSASGPRLAAPGKRHRAYIDEDSEDELATSGLSWPFNMIHDRLHQCPPPTLPKPKKWTRPSLSKMLRPAERKRTPARRRIRPKPAFVLATSTREPASFDDEEGPTVEPHTSRNDTMDLDQSPANSSPIQHPPTTPTTPKPTQTPSPLPNTPGAQPSPCLGETQDWSDTATMSPVLVHRQTTPPPPHYDSEEDALRRFVKDNVALQDENQHLRDKVRLLEGRATRVVDLERENERLRRHLRLAGLEVLLVNATSSVPSGIGTVAASGVDGLAAVVVLALGTTCGNVGDDSAFRLNFEHLATLAIAPDADSTTRRPCPRIRRPFWSIRWCGVDLGWANSHIDLDEETQTYGVI
ncbi:hypothetical protein CONLIGDRAFT_693803 [Coniochaeta ligniaria NRRL 30616]|uniref:Uncharacterized protein n=1 Tax=Coniochaeta ligniaria NRRL 30616 TaxID=1408157 RepID=A0A1J7IQ46_9PEZI|nr:hypothetical protein CONLIGDRAFT_693803 [Coniochaeta ligniaria NRRL 30616]